MPKIRLEPPGINLSVSETEVLLRSLCRAKVHLDSICGGKGTCGTCAIQISKCNTALSLMQDQELNTLKNMDKDPQKYRLSCQTYVLDDGAVFHLSNKAATKLIQIFERLKNRSAPRNIIHPVSGELLVEKDGLITQTVLERLLSA